MSRFIRQIDSQKHPVIETLRDIQTEKGRNTLSSFHVEGTMLVRRALDYGGHVSSVIFTNKFAATEESEDIISEAENQGIGVYAISEGLMAKVVPAKPAPGVVACVERKLYDPSDLLTQKSPLIFMIDKCENPDNLGMLLRSLDAAGVDGVVLTSDSADPFNRLSVRASRGSVLSLKLSTVCRPEDWIRQAIEQGFQVFATSAHAEDSFWKSNLTGPVIIVVGNEHTGVRPSIKELSNEFITIPMSGNPIKQAVHRPFMPAEQFLQSCLVTLFTTVQQLFVAHTEIVSKTACHEDPLYPFTCIDDVQSMRLHYQHVLYAILHPDVRDCLNYTAPFCLRIYV